MSDTQGNIAPTIYDYVTMSIVLPTYLKFECFSEVFRGFTGFTRFYRVLPGFTRVLPGFYQVQNHQTGKTDKKYQEVLTDQPWLGVSL